ncbi:bifunctional riboflavin kinase/FAD synthetase [Maricaulis sp. D1M11]|uniref:bifunctional riboflavin kinase/FAD synthetase n=1 Tax=Maricaulis sp. D1M11 TaxID=3076117 RepID=UPI0039B5946E
MRIIDGFSDCPDDARGAVAALGNFDGVHGGHRAVIECAAELAGRLAAPLAVALFAPHPRRFFAPDTPPFRLMSDARSWKALERLGVETVFRLPFDAEMAARTPQAFVNDVLHDGLGLKGVLTGTDFRFGAGRAGSTVELESLASDVRIHTQFVALQGNGADKISSTRIRRAIHDGDMPAAAELLGQAWTIDGEVITGDQRGRTIGFPTANIDMGDFIRPAYGVYAVRVTLPGEARSLPAVANIGKRPTVDGLTERLEVHLFDFDGDLYGQTLGVSFCHHIRPERKFDGLEALKAQIAADSEMARQLLSQAAGPV